MKEIKAIIQPFMVEKVLTALDAMEDLPGVTYSEVAGWGRLPERRSGGTDMPTAHGLTKKTKLEIVVRDDQVESVTALILNASRTGNAGDGKIFVHSVDQVIRIRTGETGPDAV